MKQDGQDNCTSLRYEGAINFLERGRTPWQSKLYKGFASLQLCESKSSMEMPRQNQCRSDKLILEGARGENVFEAKES